MRGFSGTSESPFTRSPCSVPVCQSAAEVQPALPMLEAARLNDGSDCLGRGEHDQERGDEGADGGESKATYHPETVTRCVPSVP